MRRSFDLPLCASFSVQSPIWRDLRPIRAYVGGRSPKITVRDPVSGAYTYIIRYFFPEIKRQTTQ